MKKKKNVVTDRKSKSYSFTKKFYKELRSNPEFVFRKMRGYVGEYDYSTDEISIDYRRDLLPTLIHEFLHKWHKERNETWVLRQEKLIINCLSIKQIRNIIRHLGNAI